MMWPSGRRYGGVPGRSEGAPRPAQGCALGGSAIQRAAVLTNHVIFPPESPYHGRPQQFSKGCYKKPVRQTCLSEESTGDLGQDKSYGITLLPTFSNFDNPVHPVSHVHSPESNRTLHTYAAEIFHYTFCCLIQYIYIVYVRLRILLFLVWTCCRGWKNGSAIHAKHSEFQKKQKARSLFFAC